MNLPTHPNESFRKRNPHLYPEYMKREHVFDRFVKEFDKHHPQPQPPKRIRQSTKPLMNKLEQEWLNYRVATCHDNPIPQSIGFRLGNGVVYWPDFVAPHFTSAWEIKGKQSLQDDSVVKIKVAARLYPSIRWVLVWKHNGQWQEQVVLP